MNKTTKALKLSLQRFESMNHEDSIFRFEFEDEIAAIREALAEHDHFAASGKPMDHIANSGKMIAEPWKCACGANLYIDSNGAPASKAEQALQNLSDFHQHMEATEPKCSDHPDAPHGFDRNASHNAGRYVCECEAWSPSDMAYRPNGLSINTQDQYEVGTLEDAEKFALDRMKQEPVAWILPGDLEVLLALKEKCGEIGVYGYQRSKLATNPNDATVPLYAAPVQPVKQEPVAWMDNDGNICDHNDFGSAFPIPLYTTPINSQGDKTMSFTVEDAMRKYPQISYWHSEYLKNNTVSKNADPVGETIVLQNGALSENHFSVFGDRKFTIGTNVFLYAAPVDMPQVKTTSVDAKAIRAEERKRIVDMLMAMHEKTNGQHNCYLYAANTINGAGYSD